MELTHISLFAGIGGVDIAAEQAGFRTILFVEIDNYCQKVLKKHWPDVPIIGDIRDVTKEAIADTNLRESRPGFKPKPVQETHLQPSSDSGVERAKRDSSLSPITLITGGFPCQPVSQAGKRKGKADDRWLWPEMLRVISEVRPTWVVAENVTGLLTMGFYDCLSDLEGEGYETIPFVIPACGVNAPHRRDRIFIVAYNNSIRCGRWPSQNGGEAPSGYKIKSSRQDAPDSQGSRIGQELSGITSKLLSEDRTSQELEGSSGDVAKPSSEGFEDIQRGSQVTLLAGRSAACDGSWWAVEPDVGRVAYGVPHRVDRLKCLGNAVVPQQIYPILQAIAEIERCWQQVIL